jgi:nucleoid-associated protein YgaU
MSQILTPASNTYTVIAGDTLWGICQRQYGTGLMWINVAEANNIVDPRSLKPGNILVLP